MGREVLIIQPSPDKMPAMNGTLYIVATPIGNLEDMTFRAVRILKEVGLIAAEDTRHTQKLLNHYEITTKITSYFEHNRAAKGEFLFGRLREGIDVALVSDAGTPGISDPGHDLIKGAIEAGIKVVPVPGPSAAITALSISGLPSDIFSFEGFLPAKEKGRRDRLETLKVEERTLIFYESPQRLLSTLREIRDTVGDRNVVVLRELTKIHEEAIRGRVSDILEALKDRTVKGEIVIILEGFQGERFKGSLRDELELALKNGLSMKEAIEAVSKGHGLPKSEVYKESLKMKNKEEQ